MIFTVVKVGGNALIQEMHLEVRSETLHYKGAHKVVSC